VREAATGSLIVMIVVLPRQRSPRRDSMNIITTMRPMR